ncbi:MAG: universal stress protein [Sandaracinaceae bacterium]|nr:universal stress protein [Sandaracinaceae bacterium]
MTDALVLCGIELASPDTHVLDTALLYAKELGGSVHAVHALDLGEEPTDEPIASSPAVRAMVHKVEERVAHAKKELDALCEQHATFGVPLVVSAQRGRPYEALMRLAAEAQGMGREVLFVVGAGRMQGSLVERILGSTADQLLRHAEQPVLVVPHRASDRSHGGGITRSPHGGTWLVAIDGSEPCARAVDLAAQWSERMDAKLSLVHASSDRQSRKDMHDFIASSTLPHVAALAGSIAVLEDAPHAAITGQAAAIGASLIVIGTHGRKGIARAFLGSVAASVIRHASVPVLCVR